MKIQIHHINGKKTAEIVSEEILINSTESALNLLGNLYYEGFDKIVVYEHNLLPGFFDLKTGIAGEILQKFTNYRMPLVIVGDFSKYTGKSLTDFMLESNKGDQVNFVTAFPGTLK